MRLALADFVNPRRPILPEPFCLRRYAEADIGSSCVPATDALSAAMPTVHGHQERPKGLVITVGTAALVIGHGPKRVVGWNGSPRGDEVPRRSRTWRSAPCAIVPRLCVPVVR